MRVSADGHFPWSRKHSGCMHLVNTLSFSCRIAGAIATARCYNRVDVVVRASTFSKVKQMQSRMQGGWFKHQCAKASTAIQTQHGSCPQQVADIIHPDAPYPCHRFPTFSTLTCTTVTASTSSPALHGPYSATTLCHTSYISVLHAIARSLPTATKLKHS